MTDEKKEKNSRNMDHRLHFYRAELWSRPSQSVEEQICLQIKFHLIQLFVPAVRRLVVAVAVAAGGYFYLE